MAGPYYEEFEPGHVIEHANRRTVTGTDNVLSTTMALVPSHLGEEYSKNTIRGQWPANSEREPEKHTGSGNVPSRHLGLNQRDEVVGFAVGAGLIRKGPAAVATS